MFEVISKSSVNFARLLKNFDLKF